MIPAREFAGCDFVVEIHSEHGLGRSDGDVTGTKTRWRIAALRDSAAVCALRADSSTADEDAPPDIIAIVVRCFMRCRSAFPT